MECMFTAQGPSVFHAIVVAVVQFAQVYLVYIIILDPDDRQRLTTTVRSNDTLVDTPFQLISGFFHVNQGVCVLSMLNKLPPSVCWRGGNRLAK